MIAASFAMERRLRERRRTRPVPYSKISESRPEASSAPSWPMPAIVMHHGGGDWSPRERRRRMASVPRHDRQFLLMGAKRNAVLELHEVERYGIDSYGDADWSPSTVCGPPSGIPGASACWDAPRWSARETGWAT